jgi:ADP-ribosylglycohydrolase
MLGAVVGDIVGSVHEFRGQPTKVKDFGPLYVDNMKQDKTSGLKLFNGGHGHKTASGSHFTDDTVCSMGIARWLLKGQDEDPSPILRATCKLYPRCGYGGMFSKWVVTDTMGPYNSWGNGAPMRVSPVGWAAGSLEETYDLAKRASDPTHNHPRAVKGARVVAGFIYLVRQGATKEEAIEKVIADLDETKYYAHVLEASLDEIRPKYFFKVSSKDTVPQALMCVREGKDFEDVIRNAISLGGDADTLAAIAGSMAEPLYGIPEPIAKEAILRLDSELRTTLAEFEAKFM